MIDFKQMHLMAVGAFRHYAGCPKNDPDNCGACALETGDIEGPNYAGWARAYVEAKRPIPSRWKDAFEAEQKSSNTAYAAALKTSIAQFGVKFIVG